MRIVRRRHVGILCLTLVGAAIGALAGYWLGRAMLLRAAKAELAEYARVLTHRADEISGEMNGIFRTFHDSPFGYCSDQELVALQAQTFHSSELKDIGRTRDGKLYCSAFLGRLAEPYAEGAPALVLPDGMHVYTGVAVVLASDDGDRATVVESGGVDVVLSPNAFDHWNRPHVRYAIVGIDRATGRGVPIAGSPLPFDAAMVLSQRIKIVSGVAYRVVCSEQNPVCAMTAESMTDIWGWSRAMQTAYSTLGGLAGFSLGLAIGLLYRQTTTVYSQLLRALRSHSESLRMVYEPIVDMHSRRCVGAEALVRWSDEDGVAVAPDVFVRLAEERGFIGELTAFVVRRTTEELGARLRQCPEMTLSINIAASDMSGDTLAALLREHVEQAGIDPRQIALEVTERSTVDAAAMSSAIRRFRSKGYKVHIDDFGTGYSSLSYLDQLAVNAIKIDRAFTRTIGTGAVTASILPQILAMMESLGVQIIVEGVENEFQRDYLETTGKALQLQGWFFSSPMRADELLAYWGQKSLQPKIDHRIEKPKVVAAGAAGDEALARSLGRF